MAGWWVRRIQNVADAISATIKEESRKGPGEPEQAEDEVSDCECTNVCDMQFRRSPVACIGLPDGPQEAKSKTVSLQ